MRIGDILMSLFVAGALFGNIAASLFRKGAVFGDISMSLFVAGAVFGDVAMSLFVAELFGQHHFSGNRQYLVTLQCHFLTRRNTW